jgi:hypothetical protein
MLVMLAIFSFLAVLFAADSSDQDRFFSVVVGLGIVAAMLYVAFQSRDKE